MRHPTALPVLATALAVAAGPLVQPAAAAPALPIVSAVSASSGPLAGGERLVVHGSGFSHVRQVLFGGAVAHSVRVTNSGLLTLVVPKHKAGRVDVRVVTSAGQSATAKHDRFTYVAPPTIASVKPGTGPAAGGTKVTVKGKNFLHVKAVLFGKVKGTKLHVTSSTSLSVTTPGHPAGQVDVRVITSYGTSKATTGDRLTFSAPIAPIPPGPTPIPLPPPPTLVLGTTSLPSVVSGSDYPATTLNASGGTPPYHWSARGLPGGVTLSADGNLSGSTWAVPATRDVTVTVADSGVQTVSSVLPLTVSQHAGQLYSFGIDDDGQIGDGSVAPSTSSVTAPVLVPGLSTVVSVAGYRENGYAVKGDGTVWSWGDDAEGQLGDGHNTAHPSPVQVPGLTHVTAVASGTLAAYALTSDGTIFAWGLGTGGQLGTGGNSNSNTPAQVIGAANVVSIAAGDFAAYAVRSDGTVLAWGTDTYGQLGDGGTTYQSVPIVVPGLTDVVSISAGMNDAFALHRDGTVSAWGKDDTGQLGLSSAVQFQQSTPALVPNLTDITQLASTPTSSFALRSDGTIWCWGTNSSGEAGVGDFNRIPTPRQLPGIENAQAVSAFEYGGFAILAGGAVKEWGDNHYGELGDGSKISRLSPVTPPWQASTLAVAQSPQGLTGYVVKRVKVALPPPIGPIPPPVA